MSKTMFDHAVALYRYMVIQAEGSDIYTGTKADAFRAVKISQTYYTPLFTAMGEMGSIETLYVGGRGKRVHIRLKKEPTLDEFSAVWQQVNLTKSKSRATLEEQMDSVLRRLPDIDIRSALLDIESRLKKVEQALDITERE